MHTIDLFTDELVKLTKGWNEHKRVSSTHQKKARAIGERINDAGGIAMMQAVYYAVCEKNRWASVLQAYWNGVGEWRW